MSYIASVKITTRWTSLAALLLAPLPAWAGKTPQVEANHMRWENHDALLGNAIAWQEERGGRWVTVVLLTDRPIPRESIGPSHSTSDAVEAAKAQGISFGIASGGVPQAAEGVNVWFRDGAAIRSSALSGAGGFDIESQSVTQIKGRATMHAFLVRGPKDESAWSVAFDAPVLHGDPKRMETEGEPLGTTGGQPGKDLQTALQAQRTMDYAALSAYASADLAAFLSDPATRAKGLKMLQGMTPPQSRIVGGARQGDMAQVYWVQVWPDAIDNRCIEDMALTGGKWRSVASACSPE